MKGFLVKILLTVLLVLAVYTGIFMIVPVKNGSIGTVEESSGNVASVFFEGYNFVWQGGLFWKYKISVRPLESSYSMVIEKKFSSLKSLRLKDYSIFIPLHVTYRISRDNFNDYTLLDFNRKKLRGILKKYLEGSISRGINDYLEPVYRRNAFLNNSEKAVVEAVKKTGDRLKSYGINLIACDLTGDIMCPDINTYRKGLIYAEDMRRLFMQNEKQLALIGSKIEQDKIENKAYFRKLSEVSRLIRSNPDMLKYFYIDKMADNIKVILSSDKTGYPFMLDEKGVETKTRKSDKREVDNLR